MKGEGNNHLEKAFYEYGEKSGMWLDLLRTSCSDFPPRSVQPGRSSACKGHFLTNVISICGGALEPLTHTASVLSFRQAGLQAEEDGTHPQRKDRLLFNQRHGEQETVPSQQSIGSHSEGAGQTQNSGSEEAGRGER